MENFLVKFLRKKKELLKISILINFYEKTVFENCKNFILMKIQIIWILFI